MQQPQQRKQIPNGFVNLTNKRIPQSYGPEFGKQEIKWEEGNFRNRALDVFIHGLNGGLSRMLESKI